MNIVFAFQDICTVVPHWIRYKELIAILEASLQDIMDRWADGKVLANFFCPKGICSCQKDHLILKHDLYLYFPQGPLAHEFTAQEVRGLIRALFQNTDRRAAVLGKIKPVQG